MSSRFIVKDVPRKKSRFDVVEKKLWPPEDWKWESFNENAFKTKNIPYLMKALNEASTTQQYIELGSGASGSVRKYILEGESYIVKQMSVNVSDAADNCRVQNEIQLLSKIKAICKTQFSCLLGWGKFSQTLQVHAGQQTQHKNVYLLFFPMNEGYFSLYDYMKNGSSFFETKGYSNGLKTCLNLAVALKNLHQRGIAHRDIKPANLLVDPETSEIKYIDFGGSCEEIGYGPSCTLSCAGVSKMSLGTPGYYSPEQGWAWEPTAAFKSDIWSLGVVFYNLLKGEMPWGNNLNGFQFMFAFQNLSFFGPSEPNYYCIPNTAFLKSSPENQKFFRIIQDMTRLDPRKRPSMEEVVSELEDLK